MNRFLASLFCTFAAAGLPLPVSAADGDVEVEVSQLLSQPDEWDRRSVVVTGELVGDYSPRDEGVWVQLNDDAFVGSPIGAGGTPSGTNAAIGALIPPQVFAGIEGPPGRYGQSGPIVRLEGVFIHSDPGLQGETYLAVDAATLITPAREHERPGPDLWLPVGVVLLVSAAVLLRSGRRNGEDEGEGGHSPAMP